jgi:hypothetical protein
MGILRESLLPPSMVNPAPVRVAPSWRRGRRWPGGPGGGGVVVAAQPMDTGGGLWGHRWLWRARAPEPLVVNDGQLAIIKY